MFKNGFTLVEVLIVIIAIGIIATITIPPLMFNLKERQTVAQLRKAYSVFSNAFVEASQHSSIDSWDWTDDENQKGARKTLGKILPYIKVEKICVGSTGCFAPKVFQLNGVTKEVNKDYSYVKFKMENEKTGFIETLDADCSLKRGSGAHLSNICGCIWIDVNGMKTPNRYGEDIFGFYITKYGLFPRGNKIETVGNNNFKNSCSNPTQKGFGCSAWVLEKENLDYLRKQVIWE